MSPVLRRLGVTLRRPAVRDVTCHDPRHATALELLGRIDLALREHDHRLTTDLADDVARALRVECARGEHLLRQSETFEAQADRAVHRSETFEAELIAVDEVLASAGATPATDRVEAIRAVMSQRDELGANLVQVDAALGAGDHEHVTDAATRVRHERDTDRATSKALARRVAWLQGDDGGIDRADRVPLTMADGDDAPAELRALARELHRWAPNLDALAIRDRLLDVARLLDGTASPEREATHLAARLAAAAVGTAARRCRCTGRQLGMVGLGGVGQSCVVDPRCPEHSPAWRYGGRPVQPLALPASTTAPRSRYGFDALDVWDGSVAPGGWVCDVCRMPVESEPCREHQPKAHAEMCAEAQAADPWGELGWMLHDDERDQVTRTMTAAGDPGPVLALGPGLRGTLAWTATRVYGVSDRSVGITMPRNPVEPPGYGRPRRAAGWVSGPLTPSCLHGYRLTDSCPGCDALDEQGGPRPIDDPWRDPRGPVATTLTAQCDAHPFGARCALVAGHPGRHTSAGM